MSPEPFRAIAARLVDSPRTVAVRPLAGGSTAEVTALHVVDAAGVRRTFVVRAGGSPMRPRAEARLLDALRAVGLPVPRPRLADESGTVMARPFLVLDYVEGEVIDAPADLDAFTGTLARLHAIDPATLGYGILPSYDVEVECSIARAARSEQAREIAAALRAWRGIRAVNPPVVVHGDYWPGNVLWRAGEIVAVIDWEDAAIGEPLADVARSRLELRWSNGDADAQRFTDAYFSLRSHLVRDPLPWWDLYALLQPLEGMGGWGLEPAVEARARAVMERVAQESLRALGMPSY